MKSRLTGVVRLAGLALLVAGCSLPRSTAASDASGARSVEVSASEMAFRPATVEVTTGESVKLTLANRGFVEHTWQVKMGDDVIVVAVRPLQSASTTFTAPASGSYQVICTVPGHADAGMKGTLIVRS